MSHEPLTGVEFLQMWMRTPNPMLGNIAPLALMKMGKGARLALYIESAFEAEQPPETHMNRSDGKQMSELLGFAIGTRDLLEQIAAHPRLKERFPSLSIELQAIGANLFVVLNELDGDLAGDAPIPNDDAFERESLRRLGSPLRGRR